MNLHATSTGAAPHASIVVTPTGPSSIESDALSAVNAEHHCYPIHRPNKPMVPTAPTALKELPPAFALRRHIGQPLGSEGA